MAEQRPVWRGHLRLALVSCPVALYSANHERGSLHFNLINPDTGHRIRMVAQDAETGEELSRRDLVKGYEFKKDTYLILTDEDFDSARVESSSVMTITKFIDAAAIDPVYFDASYFMAPDGDAGEDVYAVLRKAIGTTGKTALSRVVISQRERPVAIMPMGKGLVLHTLHESRELNDPDELFQDVPTSDADPEMVKLAVQLIHRQSGRFDAADFTDRYEARLRELIDAKLKGEGIEPEDAEETDRGNVIDLMSALKRSLGQSRKSEPASRKSAPAKSAASKPAGKAAPRKKAPPARRKRA
jgi:DNA end-binding protein Ku